MKSRTVERVRSWGSVSVPDGFRGLQDLADDGFSGAVVADETWLFMLNGRVVGVHEGDIDEFEGVSLSVYEAPHLSLPLLFSMQEQGGETQATYYTNDTPLVETDETLSNAGFTGYVELSENVLSGDYYTVYYGGRSMSAAFVGASEELVSGEEAFERANDEVGLYEVVKVDLEVVDVPAPAESTAVASDSEDDSESEPALGSEPAPEEVSEEESDSESTEPSAEPELGTSTIEEAEAESTSDADSAESERAAESSPSAAEGESASKQPSPKRMESEDVEESPSAREVADVDGVFSEEEAWRETTTVPSLDPEKSVSAAGSTGSEQSKSTQTPQQVSKPQSANESKKPATNESTQRTKQSGGTPDQVAALREAVEERDVRIEELKARASEAESEAEDRRAELDDLRAERDALQAEVESLQADLEAAREQGGVPSGPNDRPAAEALAGTNLFVRYESKADPTLDDVGGAGREAVNANLRLEHHTQFDASETTVNADPFEQFLEGTAAYRFVSWFVRDLPYELIDTEHTTDLGDVFDAIPNVDRAELDGTVSVRDEEGEETRMTFDVVLRDRMGNPLVVAELNPERDPVTADEMEALVGDAETIASVQDSLGGAFYVTASFFEPGALEAAEDATGGGGFLSRSDKESYVKTARKSGFHLCLVEDRNETFHVTVPEL